MFNLMKVTTVRRAGVRCASGVPRILVTRQLRNPALDILTKSGIEIDVFEGADVMPREELLKRAHGTAGILLMLTDTADEELILAAGPSLKVISTMSVGHDHVDKSACEKHKVAIGYTPGVLTDATADLACALMLAQARRIPEGEHAVKSGAWSTWDPWWMLGSDLRDATVGIVGAGRIGQATAKRMAGFGTRIVYTRSPQPELEGIGECVPFDQLISESDFVSIHCALTPDTKNLFNAATFSKMKKNAILVNTSRGPVVHQDDLYDALAAGEIRAAALDVTSPEPLPPSSKLLTLPNCLVIPHLGSATQKTRDDMACLAATNVVAGVHGNPLAHQV